MKSKKVIVTGGTGYIGSHTAVELIEEGFDVVVFDDLSNSSFKTIDAIQKITGVKPEYSKVDLKNEKATLSFFKLHKDAVGVIHFAAHKAVGESVKEPLMYYENNLKGIINVLKGMMKYNINNFIFSSSATVYGLPDKLPLLETSPTKKPFSPYGNTKKVGEEIIEDVANQTSLKAISLRYFNPIGAHESGLIGELPQGTPNNLLPYITQTAVGKLKQLNVYGNDYPTKDGTPIRDYIHVTDLAKAHIKALNYLTSNSANLSYEVFNLGTGQGYSVLDIINTFEDVSNTKLNYKITERRDGDVPVLYANADKAREKLNWKPEKELSQMINSSWIWEQKNNKN